jgi:plasmid stabilization system protein ParE
LATLIYSRRAAADLDRLADFLADDPAVARAAIDAIADAVEILERHPRIGRPVEHGLRELVISYGKTGYVALYDFDARVQLVVILAIRHQREAGYPDDP